MSSWTNTRKSGVGLGLVLVLILVYLGVTWQQSRLDRSASEQAAEVASKLISDSGSGSGSDSGSGHRGARALGPVIEDVHPNSVPPGGTVVLRFDSAESSENEIIAWLDDWELEPVEVYGDEVVFRIPELAHGEVELRLVQGGRQGPPEVLSIEALNYAKIMRGVVGGLALVVLGLLTLSRAFRRRAGVSLRHRVGTLTGSVRKSLTFGFALGSIGQTSTLAAALALPSADRHVLSFRSALVVVIAAHVGAVSVGALVPLAATREALLVIAAGVILRLTTGDTHGRALAKAITGLGLLLLGAHTLRSGLAPLAEQPSWLLELRHLDVWTPGGLLLAAVLGALLAFAAQGPGVAFVVVLSVCQATSFLDVDQGLAILAGTAMGAAMSTVMTSWPLGKISRRIALAHCVLAFASLVVMWLMLPWVPDLVTMVLGSNPEELARGKKIFRPNIGIHLAAGFITLQTLSAIAVLPAVKVISRRLNPSQDRDRAGSSQAPLPSIDAALTEQKRALEAMAQALVGDPNSPGQVDRHLDRVRELTEEHLVARTADVDTLIAILAVQQSLEQVRYTVARAASRSLTLEGETGDCIEELFTHLLAGFDEVIASLTGEGSPDVDDLRAREIRINAAEARLREHLRIRGEGDEGRVSVEMLQMAELANGFETVGNQLYRLSLSFIPDDF